MTNPHFPLKLTGGVDDADEHGPPGVKVGLALNQPMTEHVQAAYDGFTLQQRKAQLLDIDWALWKAYDMWSRHRPGRAIAEAIQKESEICTGYKRKCSVGWAQMLVKRARAYVDADIAAERAANPGTSEERLRLLEATNPDAAKVYALAGVGLPLETIAIELPWRTFEEMRALHALAIREVGPEDQRTIRQAARRQLRAQA